MLSTAPESFELTGPLLLDKHKCSREEFYKIPIHKESVTENLQLIYKYMEKVESNDFYLLHIGALID